MTEPATAACAFHYGMPVSTCPSCIAAQGKAQPATAATEYDQGYADGYAAAMKDVQAEFAPLWQAVQHAAGRSHALDSFIIERRKSSE